MRSIEYPNPVEDLVVLEYRGGTRMGFLVRPVAPGLYRLLLWPEGIADPDLAADTLLMLPSSYGPPVHATVDLSGYRRAPFRLWRWALLPTTRSRTPLEDLGRAVQGSEVRVTGTFESRGPLPRQAARFAAWSCHQPYDSESDTQAVFGEHALEILEWYADEVRAFAPEVIWGHGDTAYSDGTRATDFANEVYDQGPWYQHAGAREWLRQEYRSMYRHFWSIDPMRSVMARFPHLFIWDDHEIRDGWGSEGKDFRRGNFEMFRIATDVANEYILNAGPRVRPDGVEAHQAYVMGAMAGFVFDTRSTRNYEADRDRLISREQFDDFVTFLEALRGEAEVRYLITGTSVPFVGLRTWVTELITRAPDFINDILKGTRDDVRDSWSSPGNRDTLVAVLGALREFMLARPDVRVVNISGDIHVANAFEIHVPGAPSPIYQVTTSAITNRTHPPGLIAFLTDIGDIDHLPGIGGIRRIWDTKTDPNVLFVDVSSAGATFDLKVWDAESPGSQDLQLVL